MDLMVIRKVLIEIISDFDQNSNMAFFRNEFSKIFEEVFTMT